MATQTYQNTERTTVSPRELEASLLLKAARKIQVVKDNWDSRQDMLDEALTFNRRLWTILSTSATSPDNPLPQPVKQNIANLAVFIFTRTVNILTDKEAGPERLGVLVQINRSLAEGLRNSVASESAPK
ncbi:MAG: flagellar protein FlaF [Hyphomicrobiales bacterium]|nr:MAG: flagellar protein FlaF [Hyphomicrobiales bacterium]